MAWQFSQPRSNQKYLHNSLLRLWIAATKVPLKAVIDAVVDSEELNWNLLPPEMDDYESLDLAMDAADLRLTERHPRV